MAAALGHFLHVGSKIGVMEQGLSQGFMTEDIEPAKLHDPRTGIAATLI